jgi:anti-sigma regulatory factor (Ser/Thr protein kinase)
MNGTAVNSDASVGAYATVRLEVESRPECITLVRSVLSGLGEAFELDPELLDDLKTAVSEACNNVVLHAYGDETGPLLFGLELGDQGFDVTVRDRGVGIQRVSARENRMGVGLAVISALANRAEFESAPGEGTEVRMSFERPAAVPRAVAAVLTPPQRPPASGGRIELAGDVVATVAPVELLPRVLGRLLRAVAAGSHFTVDRLAGLHRLAEAIGQRAAETPAADSAGFAITGRPREIELAVGPLAAGSRTRLFGAGLPPELEPILADLEIAPVASGELLRVRLVQPRA